MSLALNLTRHLQKAWVTAALATPYVGQRVAALKPDGKYYVGLIEKPNIGASQVWFDDGSRLPVADVSITPVNIWKTDRHPHLLTELQPTPCLIHYPTSSKANRSLVSV